jgi:hypothetical protein
MASTNGPFDKVVSNDYNEKKANNENDDNDEDADDKKQITNSVNASEFDLMF